MLMDTNENLKNLQKKLEIKLLVDTSQTLSPENKYQSFLQSCQAQLVAIRETNSGKFAYIATEFQVLLVNKRSLSTSVVYSVEEQDNDACITDAHCLSLKTGNHLAVVVDKRGTNERRLYFFPDLDLTTSAWRISLACSTVDRYKDSIVFVSDDGSLRMVSASKESSIPIVSQFVATRRDLFYMVKSTITNRNWPEAKFKINRPENEKDRVIMVAGPRRSLLLAINSQAIDGYSLIIIDKKVNAKDTLTFCGMFENIIDMAVVQCRGQWILILTPYTGSHQYFFISSNLKLSRIRIYSPDFLKPFGVSDYKMFTAQDGTVISAYRRDVGQIITMIALKYS